MQPKPDDTASYRDGSSDAIEFAATGWITGLLARMPRWSIPDTALPRAALIFVPLALAATLVFYLLDATQLSATQRVIASGQKQLVEVGLATLSSTLATVGNDAQFVSDEPMLQQWLASAAPADRQILEAQYRSFVAHRGLYDQLRFIDTDGREELRVNWNSGSPEVVPDHQLQGKADRYYVRQTLRLKPGQIYFSPFDLNVENGAIEQPIKPTIRIGAPVFGPGGVLRGIVVLNFLGQRALDRVQRLTTQGLGEAWLVDANGYWLLGPTPDDDWGFMYPDRANRSFAQDFPAAWQQIGGAPDATDVGQFSLNGDLFSYAAVSAPDGTMTGHDTLAPAENSPGWFIVTRAPASVYSQTSQNVGRGYLAALATVLLLLAIISWTIANHSARRRQAERQVRQLNTQLARDNATLEAVNRELESFSYSVSHDLRAPLRSIDGFSQALLEDYGDALDAGGRDYLMRVRSAAQRMGNLIDDLIKLARVTRSELAVESVDLSLMARRILAELAHRDPGRTVECIVAPDLRAEGDPRLLQIALENLLENAWKFTAKRPLAMIELGQMSREGDSVYFVRDNGAGFEMAHAAKLFGVFQRLHAMSEFQGTGIGLATVQRIVYKHGGKVWAEAEKDRGATFFFTLGAGAQQYEANTSG
jgi:signal transduction histidine kinase